LYKNQQCQPDVGEEPDTVASPRGILIRCLVISALLASVVMVILAFSSSFLGPTYSDQRFTRIDVNAALSLVAAIVSRTLSRTDRVWTWCAVTGFLLFGFWVFLRAVNSVV
jgi:hypothetical protein